MSVNAVASGVTNLQLGAPQDPFAGTLSVRMTRTVTDPTGTRLRAGTTQTVSGTFAQWLMDNQYAVLISGTFPPASSPYIDGDLMRRLAGFAVLIDEHASIQAAVDYVYAAGGGTVFGAAKTYVLETQLRLYPGITLDLSLGATLQRGFNTSALGAGLIGAVTPGTKISIRGGTLDGNGQNYPTSFNIFGAAGITGLTLSEVTFKNVVDFHAVDLNACTRVRIIDCNFQGFYNLSGTREFSEAIQLDNLGGTQNTDVYVRGCSFGPSEDPVLVNFAAWPCAMGNHAAIVGVYQKGFRFVDNTVTGATWAGISLWNMEDFLVQGNRFFQGLHGVRLRLVDTVSPAQACSNVTVANNEFREMTGSGVKFASPTLANAANCATGRHTGVVITGNQAINCGEHFADIAFGDTVEIEGNTAIGGVMGVAIRFSASVQVGVNRFKNQSQSGVWVNEGTETTLAGLGYTNDIHVIGTQVTNPGFRGVHINCAARNGSIQSVKVLDPSLAAAGSREGIALDTVPLDWDVIGNSVQHTGTVTASYGISVTSGTGITVRGNSAEGATANYRCTAANTVLDIDGTSTPLGVFSAKIGSRFSRTDGGAGTSFYIKESATDATGWVGK